MVLAVAIVLAVLLVIGLLAVIGARSRMIFSNPCLLSDHQIATTVDLTRRIMERSRPGSPTWSRAAAKYKAAVDEQLRRRGETPMDDEELIETE
jgi:hypothetical protein